MQVYGIDLSKDKFDSNYIDGKGKEVEKSVKNKMDAICKFLVSVPSNAMLCAEHTGVYGDMLLFLCNLLGVKITLVPGYTIKHSSGMVKGKSDSLDAKRIREYGERFCDKLVLAEYDSAEIVELKSLYSLRSQLVKARKLLVTAEHSRACGPMQSIRVKKVGDRAIMNLDNDIKEIEDEMESIIKRDIGLRENYELINSITGIGPVISTDLIIKTGNFKTIDTARKAASYAGVCPFPNESGNMVGKRKTSPFADRKLKSLLYMGARSAVKHNKEYMLYYKKKEMEGKPYFLIMNNISNKMLRTVYSVVKSRIPFDKDYISCDPRSLKNQENKPEKVA